MSIVDVSVYALESVESLANANIISGYNGRFMPKSNVTRAEATKIIATVIKEELEK